MQIMHRLCCGMRRQGAAPGLPRQPSPHAQRDRCRPRCRAQWRLPGWPGFHPLSGRACLAAAARHRPAQQPPEGGSLAKTSCGHASQRPLPLPGGACQAEGAQSERSMRASEWPGRQRGCRTTWHLAAPTWHSRGRLTRYQGCCRISLSVMRCSGSCGWAVRGMGRGRPGQAKEWVAQQCAGGGGAGGGEAAAL